MARTEKPRKVCFLPQYTEFAAKNGNGKVNITLTVEEYEAIRLIDYLGFTQEMCATKMHISRGVVQHLYSDARRKMAQFLIDGLPLRIAGGNYELCNGLIHCKMDQIQENFHGSASFGEDFKMILPKYPAGEAQVDFMEIDEFYYYEVHQSEIIRTEVLKLDTKNSTDMIFSLVQKGINVICAFQMGIGYRNAFKEAGILVFLGMMGKPDALVRTFLENRLSCNTIVNCRYRSTSEADAAVHKPCARFGGCCLLK